MSCKEAIALCEGEDEICSPHAFDFYEKFVWCDCFNENCPRCELIYGRICRYKEPSKKPEYLEGPITTYERNVGKYLTQAELQLFHELRKRAGVTASSSLMRQIVTE